MSQEYIEITERTVSEAITAACQKLAVPSERLEYEVIDPGKTGFLGIGSRAARIRARVKQGMEESTDFDTSAIISDVLKGKDDKKEAFSQRVKEKRKDDKKENRKKEFPKNADKTASKNADSVSEKNSEKAEAAENAAQKTAVAAEKQAAGDTAVNAAEKTGASEGSSAARKGSARRDSSERNFEKGNRGRGRRRQRRSDRDEYAARTPDHDRHAAPSEIHSAPKKKSAVPVLTDEQIEEIKQRADTFLADVFQAMNLEAEVSSSYDKETGMLTIDMKGENMGVLIGKRGQTLDSLQYLVSLVVNKGIDGYIHVKADTENYRERRKKTLENLAKNIAAKVKRNRSSVALEPMNPYERRIIHSALQGDRYVTTYSEGEEPYRKVIVTMKEDR
jgi:spoIIIJ-associated protein